MVRKIIVHDVWQQGERMDTHQHYEIMEYMFKNGTIILTILLADFFDDYAM